MINTLWILGWLAITQVDDRWMVLLKRGFELQGQREYREAAKVYAAALEEAEKFGPEELPVAFVLNNMGYIDQQMGDIRDAIRLYTHSLSILEKKYSAGDRHIFEVALNLSNAYLASNEISRAESLLRRFLEDGVAWRAQDRAAFLEELGSIAAKRGRFEEAKQHYLESLEVFEAAADDKERIVIALSNLSMISATSGDLREALEYAERAQMVLAGMVSPPPVVVIKTWASAAALFVRLGRYEEADATFQRVISLCEKTYGPQHYLLGYVLTSYARYLVEMNRKKEARQVEARAKSILEQFRAANRMGLEVDARALGYRN